MFYPLEKNSEKRYGEGGGGGGGGGGGKLTDTMYVLGFIHSSSK